MIKSMLNSPLSSNILEQAVTNVIIAVAIEETVLSNILNLESEIIQKAKKGAVNLEEFVSINGSVNNMIRNIAEVQKMTQIKLQHMEELLHKLENFQEDDILEE
jgi:hypothetical protein